MTAKDAFERALAFCLRWEGGYVDDPSDPGGATNYGISLRYLKGLPLSLADIDGDGDVDKYDIRAMTPEKAAELYKRDFWDGLNLDRMCQEDKPLFSIALFDTAVNMGCGRARILAQQAAGTHPDGIWGPKTRAAFATRSDTVLAELLCFYRRKHYAHIVDVRPSSEKFLKGWLRRVDDLQQFLRTLD